MLMQQFSVFVGSSSEAETCARKVVEHLTALLPGFNIVPWWDHRKFKWTNLDTVLDCLEEATRTFDYAVFFWYPDDKGVIRGKRQFQTRDNVIFESGLFLTALGRKRTFLIRPKEGPSSVRQPTDLPLALNGPQYDFEVAVNGTKRVKVEPRSLERAVRSVSSQIRAHARDQSALSENARKTLTDRVALYNGELVRVTNADLPDTKLLSVVKDEICALLRLHAKATRRTIRAAAEDLGVYFEMVDDLLDVRQLAIKQRKSKTDNDLREVWVFADYPIEFAEEVDAKVEPPRIELRKTIAANLNQDVTYRYFLSDNQRIADFANKLRIFGTRKKKLGNAKFYVLDKIQFKTYFTIHKFSDNKREIYMSALMAQRNDYLIRLSDYHAKRICGRLENMIGHESISVGDVEYRQFVYQGP
jgi:hypothetical protein